MTFYLAEKLAEQREAEVRRNAELRRLVREAGRPVRHTRGPVTRAAQLVVRMASSVWAS
jgi:hypothetical protein